MIERFWNILYYFAYVANNKLQVLFHVINPALYFSKLPFMKKYLEKKGIDPIKEAEKAFSRHDIGLCTFYAAGWIGGIVIFLCSGLFIVYQGFTLTLYEISKIEFFILVLLPTFLINYFLLFHKDKYRKYFKEFEKKPKQRTRKWAWISYLVFLFSLLFFIGSFVFTSYMLHNTLDGFFVTPSNK